jgi:hypothetical protein
MSLQRHVHTPELDDVCDAVERTIADSDVAALSYWAVAIRHTDSGAPGQGLTGLALKQAWTCSTSSETACCDHPVPRAGGTSAAFARTEGKTISQSITDWVHELRAPPPRREVHRAHSRRVRDPGRREGHRRRAIRRLSRPPRQLPPRQQRDRPDRTEVVATLSALDRRAGGGTRARCRVRSIPTPEPSSVQAALASRPTRSTNASAPTSGRSDPQLPGLLSGADP